MNPVTFNDPFKKWMAKALPIFQRRSVLTEFHPEAVYKTPLFCCSSLDQQGLEISKSEMTDIVYKPGTGLRLPFPVMRLCYQFKEGGITQFNMLIERRGNMLMVLSFTKEPVHAFIGLDVMEYPEFEVGVRGGLLILRDLSFRCTDAQDQQARKTCLNLLMRFCLILNLPGHFRACVSPPVSKEPRSVEWIQARSYYTILSRRHPANLKHIGHGSVVHADAVKEMHRVAHSRRAHDRILRSPRYKKMQGQTIRINEMWVGPKEWQDADSKQIYKIVE